MNKIVGRCQFIKEWPGWDESIHEDEAQIARQGRAMTYPFSFIVNKAQKKARFSSTSDLPYYDTTLEGCDCYDFQGRHLPCKHMYRLAAELGIIEIIKRPTFDKERIAEIKNSDDIDSTPDQIKRQKSAEKCKPISIDYEAQRGVFAGSGKTPYETTMDTCTCRDYFVRRLPCKHIYRLRMELGSLKKVFSTGINKNIVKKIEFSELVAEIEHLTEEEQKWFRNLLFWNPDPNPVPVFCNTAGLEGLLQCQLLIKNEIPDSLYMNSLRKMDIVAALENIPDAPIKMKKTDLIKWMLDNGITVRSLWPSVEYFSLIPEAEKEQRRLYTYFRRKFDFDSYYTDEMKLIKYPAGSRQKEITITNAASNDCDTRYYFPNDEITELLTYYGHNRCLNGFEAEDC